MISCCKFAPLFASAPDQGSHCASNRLQNELGDPRHATSIYQLPSSYQPLCLLQSQLFLLYSQIVSNPSPSVSDSSLLVGSERDWAARITNWTDTLLIFLRHHLLESRKDSKGWIQLDKCRVAIAKFRWRNMFSMFGLWYLGERLFWSLLIEVGNQRVYGCSAVLWNSLMNPMRSYDISWDLMSMNHKAQNLDQRAATPPCMRNEVTSSLSSLWSLLSELRDERARNRQQIQHLAVNGSMTKFQWSHVLISYYDVYIIIYIIWLGYESCACQLCFPMCYPWNKFGKLCVRIYSSGSATVPPSHCPIVKRNTKRCQHVEAGIVFKDLCRNIYPTWTSCNQNKYIGWSLVGHWLSYRCLAVVECVGHRFYLLSCVVWKQI